MAGGVPVVPISIIAVCSGSVIPIETEDVEESDGEVEMSNCRIAHINGMLSCIFESDCSESQSWDASATLVNFSSNSACTLLILASDE